MTGLRLEEFDDFFTALHGYPPFAWQSRLCQTVGETGEWPESITAPTGTGKSHVVDVHAFVNARYGWKSGPRVPRRLTIVVNRRGIVDAHEQRALELQRNLHSPKSDVVARVAEGLRRLRLHSSTFGEAIALATLRGGLLPDRSWVDDPTVCTVICSTPDMWGSRLLFGGYGSSRQARPREAGLLAFDSVMILDEAHLNAQLLKTARRVRQLEERFPLPAPALQVVETTATPGASPAQQSIGVSAADLATEPELARRLSRPKPVTYHATDLWPDTRRPTDKYITELVDTVLATVGRTTDGTVGCVVNTVSTAIQVAACLRKRLEGKTTRNQVLTWVGPMRPLDLAAQIESYPRAFQPDGDDRVGVIVATQTIEVGVDIDFAALVTELAPGSALAQRAGRVNRLGTRDTGPIIVIGPKGEPGNHGPYEADELMAAHTWVARRAADSAGMAPLAMTDDPPPLPSPRRDVFARLETGDAEALSTTSEDLAAPTELAFWLRDDLEPDRQECGVVLRSNLPVNDLDALALLRATPPAARETFPVRVHLARRICAVIGSQHGPQHRIFAWRDGAITQLPCGEQDPKTGDVLILDTEHPIVREHTIVDYGEGAREQVTVWGFVDTDGTPVEVIWRKDDPILFDQIEEVIADEDCDAHDIQLLVESIRSEQRQVIVGRPYEGDDRGEVPWLVLRPTRAVVDDDENRQIWGGTVPVKLGAHSAAVAERARSLGLHLSLTPAEVDVLATAGLHHDDGKRDRRFQRVLGARPGDAPRAKSGGASFRRAQLENARAGLPRGWRHEQLSALLAHSALADVKRESRDLILRLVGTSHGWGRAFFPHSAIQLVDPVDGRPSSVAVELFDRGGWEALIDDTHRRIGPWACAYYEALLRAADCAVSKEGS
ncbi:type I-U CRISPR-associated helicase/endonuclease Cas3 [Mycolicibacter longobardus]|uniref:type I-G CRISPR-associated helicase/endonuclease Cas3g n=1 Tax=Mycolicibacter longobardus TaxID=1108812 RepID=UPI0013FDEC1C|nr:type I-U CRISPR-associated helicase/endonuclease Cas3 [Mycolicibacter longobardus]MCV7383974.1 type I-U CRISPR-associated helicase/endonuclease Cas3 [Mycolicibacter longobardus]